jgi:hypothetical protein
MMARAYDGSPRQIIGTLEVEFYVGLQMFLVTLQVMDIHPSYNILLGKSWIHAGGVVAFSLHICLKYIINGMLIIIKVEETVSMIKNMVVPFIKVEDCRDGNIHTFEIVNAEWVPECAVLRKVKFLEVARITTNCFLKHRVPFQYDPKNGMHE